MSDQKTKVNTVYDVYKLYDEHLNSENKHQKYSPTACTKTALLRYTFCDNELNSKLVNKSDLYLKKFPASDLKDALVTQQGVFDSLGDKVSRSSKRTYRSALKKMLEWSQSQPWWEEIFATSVDFSRPTKEPGKNLCQVRVTQRKYKGKYSLTKEEIELASALQQNLIGENFNEIH